MIKINFLYLMALLIVSSSLHAKDKSLLQGEKGLFSDWELSGKITVEELGFFSS